MASAAIGGKLSSALLPGSNHNSCLVRVVPARPLAFRRRLPARLLLASSASSVETTLMETIVAGKEVSGGGGGDWDNILACPICYRPLSLISDGLLTVDSASRASLECSCCRKTYYGKETHVELIAASGAKTYVNPMPLATEFFRLPLISFIYERGWRQNFVFGGFPGAEKEFELLKNYVKPVLGGGNIVDASCGSGLFSRLFAKSGLFSLVVALDYSENMLKQCYEFVNQESDFPKEKLLLVRADIARLPFLTGSIDALHAGAAIHCWPSPSSAVAEISRVLKPGGVFVGTTYILDGPFNFIPFLGAIRQNVSEISGAYSFISEGELEDICQACGLEGFTCVRNRQFVMFSATKAKPL